MTTLKVLRLIDSEGRPAQDLDDLVHAAGEDRRSTLRHVLERFYGPVFELDLLRASKGQFHEAFRKFGTKEGVLTKCEAFFIRAAQAAGIELSKRIVAGRHGASRSRAANIASRVGWLARSPVARINSGCKFAKSRRRQRITSGIIVQMKLLFQRPSE